MKILKAILIVLLVLAGLILAIPVFLPSEVTVTSETEIALSPELIFHNAAQYAGRDQWDPWLKMEPEAKVDITPKKGYVGSTYAWEGEKIGSGKMKVDSVNYPSFIGSSIWFGSSEDASKVEWNIEEIEGGSKVSWSFISEGSYPFGRWMLLFMKGALKSSFDEGIIGYKEYLEANPPVLYELSKIGVEESWATNAMVLEVEGTMEEITNQMMTGFPALFEEVAKQGLRIIGPAFAHYLDYDEVKDYSHALLAVPVNEKGTATETVKPRFYEKTSAVAATHYGKYDYFRQSYDALGEYIMENELEVTGEAYEVYLRSMMDSQNPMEWETMIAFPLKK